MPRHPSSARIRLCALLLVIVGSGGSSAGADGFEWIGKIELEAQGLQSPQEIKRREAVSALGRYDISLTLQYLLPALSDSDPRVRLEAGRILGRNKVAQATPIIIEWLNDPESTTKQETAGILAEIGTEEAAAALIRTLGDPDDTVRQRAAKALGAIGTPQVVVPLIGRLEDDKAEVRKAAIVELERIGDRRAVIPLVGAFNDPSLDARKAAISAVGRLGDPSPIPALLRLLRDPAEDIKQAAVTSLGNLAAVPAVDRLIEELGQGSDGYRGKVAYALGQIAMRASEDDATRAQAELAVRALVEGLAVRRLRSAASEGLRHAGRAAVPGLVAHLQGEIDGDLVSAVELLRDIGDARATPALVVELERGRLPPALLLEALSKTGDRAALVPILGLLSAKDETVRLAAMIALRPIIDDLRAADVVAKRLADPSPEIRILAAEYLGLMRSRSATPALIKLIAPGEKPELRQAAIDALGEIGDARAAGPLMDILEKGPAALHPGAASALIYIGEPALAPRLIALGADAGAAARAEAVRALGGIFRDHPEPTVREVLERLAGDADLRLSLAAIEALGAMGDARSRAALVALLASHEHSEGHRRRAAATALGNLGDRAAAAVLIAALDASDDRVSGDAAWALGKLGDEDALPALLRATRRRGWATAINASAALARYAPAARQDDLIILLYHKNRLVRVNAAMGLGRLGSESGRKPLLSALHKDPSWLVRVAAARALSRIGNAADALHRAGASDRDQTVRDAVRMLQASRFIPPERSDWRSFQVVDPDSGDAPVRQEAYFLIAADGIATALYTDARGMSGEEEFPPGSYILEPRARESRY